jgi:putative transcriptional regulator
MARIKSRLAVLMAEKGIRLNELSEKTGISETNLSLLKNNHVKAIRFSTLIELCQALDCQPGDLFVFEEE